jgi:hypothetical protein
MTQKAVGGEIHPVAKSGVKRFEQLKVKDIGNLKPGNTRMCGIKI